MGDVGETLDAVDVRETLDAVDVALGVVQGGFVAAEARRLEPSSQANTEGHLIFRNFS